jgi:hypothetical protein
MSELSFVPVSDVTVTVAHECAVGYHSAAWHGTSFVRSSLRWMRAGALRHWQPSEAGRGQREAAAASRLRACSHRPSHRQCQQLTHPHF